MKYQVAVVTFYITVKGEDGSYHRAWGEESTTHEFLTLAQKWLDEGKLEINPNANPEDDS
jgi:hypothetical protein